MQIEVIKGTGDPEASRVVDGLIAYNLGFAAPRNGRHFTLVAREDGRLLGGLNAAIEWDWLYVRHLWVEEKERKRGLGRMLMERAESEARARDCRHAYVDTFSFQAPGFYERLGYERFAVLDDFPPGYHRIFYVKKYLAEMPRIS